MWVSNHLEFDWILRSLAWEVLIFLVKLFRLYYNVLMLQNNEDMIHCQGTVTLSKMGKIE